MGLVPEEISQTSAMESTTQLLFKVPADQRRHNPGAYDPFLFTFGPYHASASSCGDADHIKLMAAEALLGENGYKTLVRKIEQRDSDIRDLYPERPGHIASLPDLAFLFARDAVAIIARVVKPAVFKAYPMAILVYRDAILLENQIPVFVLQFAIESLKAEYQDMTIDKVLEWYSGQAKPFPNFCLGRPPLSSHMREPLLAYIYDSLTQSSTELGADLFTSPGDDALPTMPTASQLRRYGVKFLACDKSFNGIKFDKKAMALSIPRIRVYDTTMRFLLNLLAYEAISRFPRQFSVISYVYFMDRLIDSEEDVQLLVKADVIRNALGSHKELASSWNKLCISVEASTTTEDRDTINELNDITNIRWRAWMAAYHETYWEKKPWLLIPIVAATVLLTLTFLQTVYTMKSYHGK